jgi:ribosomal protein L37E
MREYREESIEQESIETPNVRTDHDGRDYRTGLIVACHRAGRRALSLEKDVCSEATGGVPLRRVGLVKTSGHPLSLGRKLADHSGFGRGYRQSRHTSWRWVRSAPEERYCHLTLGEADIRVLR